MATTATRSLRPLVAGVRNRWPTVGLAVSDFVLPGRPAGLPAAGPAAAQG